MSSDFSQAMDSNVEARRARFHLVGSASLFGLMAVGAKVASVRIPGPQIALVRFGIGIAVVLVAVLAGWAVLRPHRWGWLFARGFFGGLAVFAYFSCIEKVGVGVATLLNYTAPVWAVLLGWWLLGERPRRSAVGALTLTMCGVVFVVGDKVHGVRVSAWELVGVLSAVASGIAITAIRAARRPAGDGLAENAWTVFASFTALGFLTTVPGVVGPLGTWVAPSGGDWLLLLAIGFVSLGAQLIMTAALEHVTVATSGIIHQLTVVIAMAAGVVFLGERLTLPMIFGSLLTVAGVAWTVLASARAAPVVPPSGT